MVFLSVGEERDMLTKPTHVNLYVSSIATSTCFYLRSTQFASPPIIEE
jgi:hypothetical protein